MQTQSARHAGRRIHPANLILAAVGCIGIGAMIGGWTAEQPARRGNSPIVRPDAPATSGQIAGIAIDPRSTFLYRTFTNGRVERLPLSQGVTQQGTTAEWQIFKAP